MSVVTSPSANPMRLPQQRIELRHSLRSLENFLSFDFSHGKRLSLADRAVYGCAVKVLEGVDKKEIRWTERASFWWNDRLNLKRVCHYVAQEAPKWAESLGDGDEKRVALERQLALLERKVGQYNQEKLKFKPDATLLTFSNPLRHVLNLQVVYPEQIGHHKYATVNYAISYDRLMTTTELSEKINQVLNCPVTITVVGDKNISNPEKYPYSLKVIPQHIFKKAVYDPVESFDPVNESAKLFERSIKVTYDDVDWSSVVANFYILGQNESMPRVYQQGVLDGRNIGYIEAINAINGAFSSAGNKPPTE